MASSGQKVVLITGCSSGIGLRIAVTLAKDEKKRYHGKCAFFYIVSLIGDLLVAKPLTVCFAFQTLFRVYSPLHQPSFLRIKFG